MSLPDFISDSAAYLRQKNIPEPFEAAIILGSGLGSFVERIAAPLIIPYANIPHFPSTSVKGHEGKLIAGNVNGKNVIAFSGRFHHYEGFNFEQTALPVYLAAVLGVNKLLISNAVGAVNTEYNIGDLVVIDSVVRQNLSISPRKYPVNRYNHNPAVEKTCKLAKESDYPVRRGTFIFSKGPNYETKAEIRAYRKMGGDIVGMSTAPELFEASRLKLKTVAISLVTNMAAGVTGEKLNHDEVKEAAETKKEEFAELVELLIENL